jgi:uncharacterized membrane protein
MIPLGTNSTMERLAELGRSLFVIPFAVFGVQYFPYGHYDGGLSPVPPWAPGGPVGAYLIGAFLVVAAISVLARWHARLFATLLGLVYLLCVLLLHSQHFTDILYNGRERTRALEPLSLAGAAFVLAGFFPSTAGAAWDSLVRKLAQLGRYLFSLPLLIYGLQHFLYASFIATLIPAWMPARLFPAYFTGVAFIAAATKPWDVFVEYAGDFPDRGGSRQILHFGTSYELRPHHQIDFHVAVGLTHSAPDAYVGFGYSFLFFPK